MKVIQSTTTSFSTSIKAALLEAFGTLIKTTTSIFLEHALMNDGCFIIFNLMFTWMA